MYRNRNNLLILKQLCAERPAPLSDVERGAVEAEEEGCTVDHI
jgi:hypothetical protein